MNQRKTNSLVAEILLNPAALQQHLVVVVPNLNEQYTSRRNNALFLPIEPLCTHALMLFTGWPFKTEEYKRACAHHIAWVAGQQLLFLSFF